MKKKSFAKVFIIIGILLLLASGYIIQDLLKSIEGIRQSIHEVDTYLDSYVASPFKNSAMFQTPPEPETQSEALYSYQATDTLTFLSHSEQWDEGKLKDLHEELLKNEHGEEMSTLHEVVVWPHEEEHALATHSSDVITQRLAINFGALPKDFHLNFARNVSLIALYGGDKETTIEDMAWPLSHEYGHLYTFHYMFSGNNTDLATTEYGQLRKSVENGLNTSPAPGDDYFENHAKYLFEVAAEDYVQLMGSPTTRRVVAFKDVQQHLNSGEEPSQKIRFSGNNANPQGNLELPLASEVDGLSAYFYQFIGTKARLPLTPRSEIQLSIDSDSQGYNLVDGYRNFVHYNLSWNTPYSDTIYTLVCYDANAYQVRPIKTVHIGETASAIIGTIASSSGNYVRYFSDEIDSGTKVFLVIAQLPDGTYYSSEPLEYTF